MIAAGPADGVGDVAEASPDSEVCSLALIPVFLSNIGEHAFIQHIIGCL